MSDLRYKEITEDEWNEYEWIEVNQYGNEKFYLRGVKRTQPPQDGYHYEDVTKYGDSEQRWERAKTIHWSLG
jgi:hypothetical protein